MIVAGLRIEPILQTPRSVDVLDRIHLQRLAGRTTPELLMDIPGVVVQKTNHGGGSPFIRGFTGQHVLYLIDGIRLNNSTTRYGPNQALNTVDPYTIRRLELLRGPGSLLYGSDAIGGVIYLVPRSAPYRPGARFRWGGQAAARFGSADLSQVYNLGAWTQYRRMTVFGGGSFKDFNSLVGGRDIGKQAWTGYQEGDWDGAVKVYLNSAWSLKLAVQGVRQYDVPRTDKCSATDFRYYRKQFRDLAWAKLSGGHGKLLDRFDVVLSYQSHRERRDRFRLSRDRIEIEQDRVHTFGLHVVGGTDLGRWSRLTYGLDIYHDWVGSNGLKETIRTGERLGSGPASERGRFVDGSRYLQGGVFLADTLKPTQWLHIRAGGRFAFAYADIPVDPLADAFGLPEEVIRDASFGGGAGLSVTFIPHRSVRLIAGAQHAFRAPNLDDYSHVGSEGAGFDIPSARLKPEQATTFEVGLKWACRWVTLWAFGHYSLLQDFIARQYTGFDVEGEPATERANMASGYMAGVEGSLTVKLPRGFFVSTWLSWTRGDLEMGLYDPPLQPMRRVSPLQGRVAAGYRGKGGVWAQAAVRWSTRQHRLSPEDYADSRICPDGPVGCDGTPGFAMVSLAGGVDISRHATLTLRLENVGNAPYKYHGSGVYAPGTSAIAELRLRL